ncbi:hypothetical protein GGH95_003814, partial [Coemansia sp. RSA 1836]
MSSQKEKSSASRRGAVAAAAIASKTGRKPSSSTDQPKLEPLPEIPDGRNYNAAAAGPSTTSSPAVASHSSSRRTQKSELDATSYPGSSSPSMQVADAGAMHVDASLGDASIRTPTASSDHRRHHHPPSPAVEADSVGSTSSLNQAQRPRSRTASPWRAKTQSSAGLFTRPKAKNASRQSATDTQLALKHDDSSSAMVGAVAGSDGSMNSSGISSAGLVLERASTIASDRPDQYTSAQQRRRGLTMDPDRFGARQIGTSTGAESGVAAGSGGSSGGRARAERPAAQQQQPATASHFHVSLNNTALAARADRRALQPAPPGHPPTRLAKNDSGSSNNTMTTVELDASASSTHSNEMPDAAAPRGQLSKMLYNN